MRNEGLGQFSSQIQSDFLVHVSILHPLYFFMWGLARGAIHLSLSFVEHRFRTQHKM